MTRNITQTVVALVLAGFILSFLGLIFGFVSKEFRNFLLTIWVKPTSLYLLKDAENEKSQQDDPTHIVGTNKEGLFLMKDQDIQDVLERQLGKKLREQPSDSDNKEFFIMMKNGELTIKERESIIEELSNSLESRLTTVADSQPSMAIAGAGASKAQMPGDDMSRDALRPRPSGTRAEQETMPPPSKEDRILSTSKEEDAFGSQELAVIKSQFCLKIMRPECAVPANAAKIPLSDIETIEENVRRLFFWTSMKADLGSQSIVHIWSSSKRPDGWYKTVHISIDDKVEKFTVEDEDRLRGHLSKIEQEDPNIHAVQAVVLSLDRSGGFRTYSSIRAVPGKYTVELRYPDGRKIVPGGGAKTIVIEPSH